ncbi:MAG: AAA family ATPase [Planctomycetes bacterium]|nr:AAA family ATPase [Planctomycetota bacterium]
MPHESSLPVVAAGFYDRTQEIERLAAAVRLLAQGSPKWMLVLGRRKIGKSSLLLEFQRRLPRSVARAYLDLWASTQEPRAFLAKYLGVLVASFLAQRRLTKETGLFEVACKEGEEERFWGRVEALHEPFLDHAAKLAQALRQRVLKPGPIEGVIDLPQALADELRTPVVVILDEFQEIRELRRFPVIRRHFGDWLALLRSRWQQHRRVGYLLAGSKVTLLREMVEDHDSPFFQHFEIVKVEELPEPDARRLLRDRLREARKQPAAKFYGKVFELLGRTPFYLQILASELANVPRTLIDEEDLKRALQALLFDPHGRLSLYLEGVFRQIVGRSTHLEQMLQAFSVPSTPSEAAWKLGTTTAVVSTHLRRLRYEDVLERSEDGKYAVADPMFALWLRSRPDEPRAFAPYLLGDATERRVVETLGRIGFRLVYQSRASRGAFDLLALHEEMQLGIQCRRTRLPHYVGKEEYHRMASEARRLRWVPLLALDDGDAVRFYHLRSCRRSQKHFVLDEKVRHIENLWDLRKGS